jgi:acyl-coenzyme A thioesterase PaaI-like protein
MNDNTRSLQETYAPNNRCFGCGPANEKGLRIRSFPVEGNPDELEAEWTPGDHHEAFDGILNGGIVGALLDCHANWTACWYLMRRDGQDTPPCTVTAQFTVKMMHPTPSNRPVTLRARVRSSKESRVDVDAELMSDGKTTATCDGVFVAVKPGHPAYHRW